MYGNRDLESPMSSWASPSPGGGVLRPLRARTGSETSIGGDEGLLPSPETLQPHYDRLLQNPQALAMLQDLGVEESGDLLLLDPEDTEKLAACVKKVQGRKLRILLGHEAMSSSIVSTTDGGGGGEEAAWQSMPPKQQAFRVSLVLFTYLAAALIPNLGVLIALIGAISGSLLAIIIPALINLRCHLPSETKNTRIRDWCFVVIGVIGGFWGSVLALREAVIHGSVE